jgi:hypothetical protein
MPGTGVNPFSRQPENDNPIILSRPERPDPGQKKRPMAKWLLAQGQGGPQKPHGRRLNKTIV